MTDEEVDDSVNQGRIGEAYFEAQFGSKEKALSMLEPEMASPSSLLPVKIIVTSLLIDTGRLEQSIALGRRYLASGDLEPMQRASLENNLAYALYLRSAPEDLDEADAWSEAAYNVFPMLMAVKSTCGAVLIARGEIWDGVNLLQDKRFRLETRSHRATVLSTLAIGWVKLGEPALAERLLKRAHALDPHNPHRSAAQAWVEVERRKREC